jgi:hypothetical protein
MAINLDNRNTNTIPDTLEISSKHQLKEIESLPIIPKLDKIRLEQNPSNNKALGNPTIHPELTNIEPIINPNLTRTIDLKEALVNREQYLRVGTTIKLPDGTEIGPLKGPGNLPDGTLLTTQNSPATYKVLMSHLTPHEVSAIKNTRINLGLESPLNLEAAANFVRNQVGKPYGGSPPYSYDCQSLIMAA